jgi:hypothetical protein
MSPAFAHSNYMPCAECGASVAAADREAHECEPERLLDYRMFQLRSEVAGSTESYRVSSTPRTGASRSGSQIVSVVRSRRA